MAKYNHYYRIITQKTRKKPLKQEKITILSHFHSLPKHLILFHPFFFSISLIFNLIQNRSSFLCYRILHYIIKNKRESFCKRLAEKHARNPENEPQKAIFTPSEWQKWEEKWEVSAWKARKIQKYVNRFIQYQDKKKRASMKNTKRIRSFWRYNSKKA